MYRWLGSIVAVGLLVVGGCWLLTRAGGPAATAAPVADDNLEQSLKKAAVNGKYRMLLA